MPGVSLTPEAPAQAPAEPSVPGGFDIPGHSGPNAVQIPGNDPSVAVVSGFVPGLGEFVDSYEAIIGRDFFSGDSLTPEQRAAALAGLLIPGFGRRAMEAVGGAFHFLGNFSKKAKPASEADTVIKSAPEVDCPKPPPLPQQNRSPSTPPVPRPTTPVPYPLPDDGRIAPGPDWVWKGKDAPGGVRGNWHNPKTGESLWGDLDHPPPIGPHWDWIDADGKKWRIFPDGRVEPKK